MAETEATNQDGAKPKPEAQPPLSPVTGREGTPQSERAWLAERRRERETARSAIQTLKETPEPKPEPETEPTSEVSRETESEAQAVEPEAEGSESAEAQTEAEATEAPQGESEEYFPETLPEFIEALGVESKDFMQGVTVPVKVNGEDVSVPIAEILESYSSKAERDRLGQAIAEDRKAIQAAAQQHEQEHQGRLQQADTFLHALQSSVQMGPSDQDLNQMLNSGQIDEKTYLTARSERDQKVSAFNQAIVERNQMVADHQTKQQETATTFRKEQQDRLMDWRPDLQEPAKLSEFETAIRSNLKGMGYTDQRVERFFGEWTLEDLKLIEKAMKYDQLMAQEKPIKQRLHQLPKLQKPGPKRSGAQQANDVVLGARNRLKSSGSAQDAVALMRAKRAQRNQSHGGSQ